MLKTALKPQWIALLLLAIVVSTVFVLLSRWQFEQSVSSAPPPLAQTETPVALTEHFEPLQPLMADQADQMVTFTGTVDAATTVQISSRIENGQKGYWLVAAATVENGPEDFQMPVVWGWSADALDYSGEEPDVVRQNLRELFTAAIGVDAAETPVEFTGRLLPPDGPQAGGLDRHTQPYTNTTVATSELTNIWDVPLYAGYVAVESYAPVNSSESLVADGAEGIETVDVAPQPQEQEVVWLNIFYAVEWVIFAAMALYLWWRFMRDDHLKDRRERALDEEWQRQWTARELQRRRDEARAAKEQADRAYREYHGLNSEH